MNGNGPNPPDWAERAFMAMLPPTEAETESGDLLEVYRDEQVPVRGRAAADRWYVRQVIVAFVRNYGLWLAALVALFVMQDVANTRSPSRPSLGSPAVLIGVILIASLHGGWRTRRWEGGLFAGTAMSLLLWLFMATWWMTAWYPFLLTHQVGPHWIQRWQASAAPGESFAHWIVMDNAGAAFVSFFVLNASGVAAGIAGGLGGAAARQLRRA